MSSMAQQAKPNSMYHWEEARPQLSKSSTLVVNTVSGNDLIKGFMIYPNIRLSNLDFLHPHKVTLDPVVDQAKKQDANKNKYFDKLKEPLSILDPAPEHRGHWKNKGNFHLKYDKD